MAVYLIAIGFAASTVAVVYLALTAPTLDECGRYYYQDESFWRSAYRGFRWLFVRFVCWWSPDLITGLFEEWTLLDRERKNVICIESERRKRCSR